jgi:hypothetical protein
MRIADGVLLSCSFPRAYLNETHLCDSRRPRIRQRNSRHRRTRDVRKALLSLSAFAATNMWCVHSPPGDDNDAPATQYSGVYLCACIPHSCLVVRSHLRACHRRKCQIVSPIQPMS